jgi:hypothetical protein
MERVVWRLICFLIWQGALQEVKLFNGPQLAAVQCEDTLPVSETIHFH